MVGLAHMQLHETTRACLGKRADPESARGSEIAHPQGQVDMGCWHGKRGRPSKATRAEENKFRIGRGDTGSYKEKA